MNFNSYLFSHISTSLIDFVNQWTNLSGLISLKTGLLLIVFYDFCSRIPHIQTRGFKLVTRVSAKTIKIFFY